MNEIQTAQQTAVATIDYAAIATDYIQSMGNKLPQSKLKQFVELAKALQLNPFKREIYAVGYGENWNIITGYEIYIKRANLSGLLAGWKAWTDGKVEDGTLTAYVEINRKDWSQPFRHEVYFDEVKQTTKDGKLNSVWNKMPRFMCKKVAIAQGFRLCFPDILGGMPYTSDELPEIEQPTEAPKQRKIKDITEEAYTTPTAEMLPPEDATASLAIDLENLREAYFEELAMAKGALESIDAALASGDDTQLTKAYDRTIIYLRKRGAIN